MNLKFCSIQTSGEIRWDPLLKSQNTVTDFGVVFMRQIELHQPAVFTYASTQSQREGWESGRVLVTHCLTPCELWIGFCLLLEVLLRTVTLNMDVSFCFMISTFFWCSEQTSEQPAGVLHLVPRSTSPAPGSWSRGSKGAKKYVLLHSSELPSTQMNQEKNNCYPHFITDELSKEKWGKVELWRIYVFLQSKANSNINYNSSFNTCRHTQKNKVK